MGRFWVYLQLAYRGRSLLVKKVVDVLCLNTYEIMKQDCEEGNCNISQEDYDSLDYRTKYLLAQMFLRFEEAQNEMLYRLKELKEANNPISYYARLLKFRFSKNQERQKEKLEV